MEAEDIYAIMNRWVSAGSIAESERQALKAEYLRQLGVTRCTTCPSFWHDLKIHFLLQLRASGLPKIMATRKYMIADGGFLQLPGSNTMYINEGVNTNGNEVLTDEAAEEILTRFPGFAHLIVVNPEYKEAKPKAAVSAPAPAKPAKTASKTTPAKVATTEPATPEATVAASDAVSAVAGE